MGFRTVVAALALTASLAVQAMSADELIAKNIEAKGGLDKIKAIQSLRLSGKIVVQGGQFELEYTQVNKRPNFFRSDATVQGLTMVQAYDGQDAWQIFPFQGRLDPDKMSADDAKNLVDQADFDGPLIDYKSKGSSAEYLGVEDVDGTPAHKLKITQKNGDIYYYYFDPDYFLEIRVVSQRQVRGTQVSSESDIGNYEKVEGVYLPFSIEAGPKGGTPDTKTQITFTKAEANVSVDEAQFHFPQTPKACK
jgi:hypothetical protein